MWLDAKRKRFNSQFCATSAREFNKFIHEAGVQEFKMGGKRFTYMSRVDAKLSKLDRFLACPDFLFVCPATLATTLPRDLSYHYPITLTSTRKDFGHPSFRFYNSWLLVEGLDLAVMNA